MIALSLWVSLSGASGATTSATTTKTFNFTEGEQIFEVPDGVTSLDVLAVGGKGSVGYGASARGGLGAMATGTVAVSPGQTLFIAVGGNGGLSSGGWNGGGPGGGVGGGGGGATDIRTISRAGSGNSLASRLIIAGGGGGSGYGGFGGTGGGGGDAGDPAGPGGGNDGLPGSGGVSGGFGASLTAGGAAGGPYATAGSAGQGGNGSDYGGGGGGGTFGGGGGDGYSGLGSAGGGGGAGSTSFALTVNDRAFNIDGTGVPLVRLTYNAGGGNKSGLKFGKVKLNKQKGTAILPVTVPGTGDLSVGGKGVVKKRPGGRVFSRVARKITEAGTYKLKIKAKGKKKVKLFDTGKVKVKAVVTFKPTSGDAVHDSKKIKLRKN
jgi:hypothetical protein